MSFLKKLKTDISQEEKKEQGSAPKKKNQKKVKAVKIVPLDAPKEGKKETKEASPKKKQGWPGEEGQLAVDVFYSGPDFCVQAPIAGVAPEDLDVSVENEMLIIKGARKDPVNGKQKDYFYQECYWGPFSRQIILPEDVDSQRIKASLQKGVLTIKMPRIAKTKKKKVDIKLED